MKLLVSLLIIALTGCAGRRVTLEDLMRETYYVSCVETSVLYLQSKDYENPDMLKFCRHAKEGFDLHQIGIYDDSMEVYRHYRQTKEGRF